MQRHWTFINWSRTEFSIWKSQNDAGIRSVYSRPCVSLNIFIFVLLRSPFCLLILLCCSCRFVRVFYFCDDSTHSSLLFFLSLLLLSVFIRIFKLWRHQYTNWCFCWVCIIAFIYIIQAPYIHNARGVCSLDVLLLPCRARSPSITIPQ